MNTVYVYEDTQLEFATKISEHEKMRGIELIPFSKLHKSKLGEQTHLVISARIAVLKEVFVYASEYEMSIGVIALDEQYHLRKTFHLPKEINAAIDLALTPSEIKKDLLFCDDKLVLQEVVIGNAPPLDQFESSFKRKGFFKRLSLLFSTLKNTQRLKHTQMTLTNNKENEIKISAVGLVGVEYNNHTCASSLVSQTLNSDDGKFSLVILAPSSILQYFSFIIGSFFSYFKSAKLPNSVGYIRSAKINIQTATPSPVYIDAVHVGVTPVTLHSQTKMLALSVGESFEAEQGLPSGVKDSIKIDHLPSDEESADYLSRAIPLFTHASREQYTSLFSSLREEGILNSTFMILLLLSAMIATFGLFINSSSVIIGAMLLAPLMQPIVSLSMGVLRRDTSLISSGSKTIITGVLSVLFLSAFITVLLPLENLTSEMAGRLSPTLLDLFVAIISGVAAAYAKSNEKIIGSLAGVAIAVALVPPITVAGIGLGWGEWHMFYQAFLLFMTNLVGIVLAAAFTFLLLGFSPIHVAKKGILLWIGIVLIIGTPLYQSYATMTQEIYIQKQLTNSAFNIGKKEIELSHINLVRSSEALRIEADVISDGYIDAKGKKELKEKIEKLVGEKVELLVTFRYRL